METLVIGTTWIPGIPVRAGARLNAGWYPIAVMK